MYLVKFQSIYCASFIQDICPCKSLFWCVYCVYPFLTVISIIYAYLGFILFWLYIIQWTDIYMVYLFPIYSGWLLVYVSILYSLSYSLLFNTYSVLYLLDVFAECHTVWVVWWLLAQVRCVVITITTWFILICILWFLLWQYLSVNMFLWIYTYSLHLFMYSFVSGWLLVSARCAVITLIPTLVQWFQYYCSIIFTLNIK